MKKISLFAFFLLFLAPQKGFCEFKAKDKLIYSNALEKIEKRNFDKAIEIAQKAKYKLPIKYLEWLKHSSNEYKSNFYEIKKFINQNPNFPKLGVLRRQLEIDLKENQNKNDLKKWFDKNHPYSAKGMFVYSKLLFNKKENQKAIKIVKEAWHRYRFDKNLEKSFYRKYKKHLTNQDNITRIKNMLNKRYITQARRVLYKLSSEHKKLYKARIYTITSHPYVDKAIKKVPKKYINDEGLNLDRAIWRRKHDKYKSALEIHLSKNIANKEYKNRWYQERAILIRHYLSKKDYKTAFKLANKDYKNLNSYNYAQSAWLSGWISLRFLNNPKQAIKDFYNMHENVKSPISKARASYWLGRAFEQTKQNQKSKKWYNISSQYKSTFYGQEAYKKLHNVDYITLKNAKKPSKIIKNAIKNDEITKIISFLSELNQERYIKAFCLKLLEKAKSEDALNAVLETLTNDIKRPDLAVYLSRKARFLRGDIYIKYGYPVAKLETPYVKDQAFLLSLIRQESDFNKNAKSHAGARGLMQIMPYTAKISSKKINEKYSKKRLKSSPKYNIKVGSYYLSKILENYDNNYALSLAGYNAGTRRLRDWLKIYGNPNKNDVDLIDWIELIPYKETRNYIHRVLENYKIYKNLIDS